MIGLVCLQDSGLLKNYYSETTVLQRWGLTHRLYLFITIKYQLKWEKNSEVRNHPYIHKKVSDTNLDSSGSRDSIDARC